MGYENNDKKQDSVYSKRIKAGKRRTYFFDVRATRGNDFYLTITESRKRFNEDSYERHKIFLYKEDFNKFLKGLSDAVDYVKTELMPDFDFDAFSHEYPEGEPEMQESRLNGNGHAPVSIIASSILPESETETVPEIEPEPEQVVVIREPEIISGNGTHEEVDKW